MRVDQSVSRPSRELIAPAGSVPAFAQAQAGHAASNHGFIPDLSSARSLTRRERSPQGSRAARPGRFRHGAFAVRIEPNARTAVDERVGELITRGLFLARPITFSGALAQAIAGIFCSGPQGRGAPAPSMINPR